MALTTKLHSSFWSDEDLGQLSSEGKLSIVWVLTNKDMNNIGFLKVSRRQFQFDTGLPIEALQGALKGLPRGFAFEETEGGLAILAVNYVKYQFGDHTLTEKNHITKHLCNLLMQLSDTFRERVLERYEPLARAFRILRPLQAPYKGHIRDQNSTVQHSTEKSLGGGLGEPQTHLPLTPGSGSSPDKKFFAENGAPGAPVFHVEPPNGQLRYDLAEELLGFLNLKAGTSFLGTPAVWHTIALRLYEAGQDVEGVKRMIGRQVLVWSKDGKMREYLRPATLFGEKFGDYYGQRDLAVTAQASADRAVELQGLIERSRANRDSAYWSSEATAEEKEQLKNWRAELRQITSRKAAA